MESQNIASQLKLEVSSDQMKAQVRVPRALVSQLRMEDLSALVNSYGIKFGFNPAKLMAQLDGLHKNPQDERLRVLTLAQGLPTVPSQDGRIELLIQESVNVSVDDASGRADFRNIDKFKQIQKNTLLARRILPIAGKDGNNIYGETVHPREASDPKLVCGDNVAFLEEKNEYRSTEKGIFIRKGDVISISPVLYVPGNAGLETGNLIYDGNVHIRGNIERGALVSTLEELHVEGFIESNLIRVGRSLHVHKGINAQGENPIYIEGDLYSTYLDNTNIVILGESRIRRSINASTVMAHGNIEMEEKRSVIVGGTLHAFGSLSADYIGNSSGTPTKIILGIHHANEKYYNAYSAELKNITKKYNTLHAKILEYKEKLKRMKASSEFKEKVRRCYQEYTMCSQLIQRLKEQIAYYSENMSNPNPVRLTARMAIYPGVQYTYKGKTHNLKAPLHRSIIEFSPNKKEEPNYMPYAPEESKK